MKGKVELNFSVTIYTNLKTTNIPEKKRRLRDIYVIMRPSQNPIYTTRAKTKGEERALLQISQWLPSWFIFLFLFPFKIDFSA